MTGPGGQAAVWLHQRPPAAVLAVPQREHLPHVAAKREGRPDAGEAGRRPVEYGDLAGPVGNDETVRQVVGEHQSARELVRLGAGDRYSGHVHDPRRCLTCHDLLHLRAASARLPTLPAPRDSRAHAAAGLWPTRPRHITTATSTDSGDAPLS